MLPKRKNTWLPRWNSSTAAVLVIGQHALQLIGDARRQQQVFLDLVAAQAVVALQRQAVAVGGHDVQPPVLEARRTRRWCNAPRRCCFP